MSEEPAGEELLARVARQDAAALGELYDRYAPRVYGLMFHILVSRAAAEEALQEVFLRLWEESSRLSEEGRSVAAWLIVIAREAAIGRLRGLRPDPQRDDMPPLRIKSEKMKAAGTRKSKDVHHAIAGPKTVEGKNEARKVSPGDGAKPPSLNEFSSAWLPQPKEIDLIEERLGLLHKAVNQLPKPQRQALELAVFRGLRDSEIAVELGEPLGKVRSSLRAAVTHVKHRRRAVCGTWAANI